MLKKGENMMASLYPEHLSYLPEYENNICCWSCFCLKACCSFSFIFYIRLLELDLGTFYFFFMNIGNVTDYFHSHEIL